MYMLMLILKGPYPKPAVVALLVKQGLNKESALAVLCIHPFEKSLSGEKYKQWTMRHNGTLERWQGQVCY